MNNLNSLIIEGNAELKVSEKNFSGFPCTVFNLTTERKNFKNESEFSTFPVYSYGKIAESLEYSLKNSPCHVRVVGKLKQNKFTDKKKNVLSEVVIIAEHIEILKSKRKKIS